MTILRVAIYFLSGLLMIGGIVCVGIFMYNGSIEAIGGAVMFFCFGIAGIVLGIFLNAIVRALRPRSAITSEPSA